MKKMVSSFTILLSMTMTFSTRSGQTCKKLQRLMCMLWSITMICPLTMTNWPVCIYRQSCLPANCRWIYWSPSPSCRRSSRLIRTCKSGMFSFRNYSSHVGIYAKS